MSERIQAFRFDEAVPRIRKGATVRGKGVNGSEIVKVEALMYPVDAGIPGLNIRFSCDTVKDGYFSPRHRHNFDQVRYVLSGTINIGKGVTLAAGECAYFPEGTYYGPQEQKGDGEVFVMQFPGPQAAYFLLQSDFKTAMEKLLASGGVFEDGAYRRVGADGQRYNQDGFEAVWEAHNGQPVTYAAPRYAQPVVIKPGAFDWVPDERRAGLAVKQLGTFNEYRTSLAEWRLDPAAVLPSERLEAPEFRYVLKGAVNYAGKTLAPRSCLYVAEGVNTEPLECPDGAELLVISVPMYVPSVWSRARQATAEKLSAGR